jgi:putative transposase/transposase-like zinc-binding protein
MCKANYKEKKHTLSEFFNEHWDKYLRSPKERILPEQLKAVNAMLACRTPKLGIDLYHCPDCNKEELVYHSCRNRFCPTCGYLDTLKWSESILGKMIDKPHHHVVIMLPAAFRGLAKINRKLIYGILMKSAAEAFKEWFMSKWKIEPGIMTVLHTFGDDKKYHVHLHMLITAGGINKQTGEYKEIDTKKWFVNYSWFCNNKFRPIFEKYITRSYKNGELRHNFKTREEFTSFIEGENKKKWRMHIEEPLENTEHIVKYIGRYTKRACLSEYKITNIEGEYISFECKDYKNSIDKKNPKIQELKFHYSEFFPRLLQHVPEKYFRIVRYYGVYHHMKKNVPEKIQKTDKELQKIKEKELIELKNYKSPLNCPCCDKKMVYKCTLIDKRKRNRNYYRKHMIPDDIKLESFIREIKKIRTTA